MCAFTIKTGQGRAERVDATDISDALGRLALRSSYRTWTEYKDAMQIRRVQIVGQFILLDRLEKI